MNYTLQIIAAVVPALVLFFYIYKRDVQPEPFHKLLNALLIGIAICIPVAFAELYISNLIFAGGEPVINGAGPKTLFGTTVNAFLVAAVPEEAAKLLALWLVLRKNKYFDEHCDGIVYAVCVSLGFALIENIFYVVGSGANWMNVALGRAFLAVPGHYAFGVLMGYYYSIYHFGKKSHGTAIKILLMPVLAHGVYDSLAMSGSVNAVAGAICSIALIYFCIKLQKVALGRINELAGK